MQQIINFFIKNSTKLLFLLLLATSLLLTIQTHSFHRSRVLGSANAFTGYVYEKINNTKIYFNLRQQNDELAFENAELKKILYNSINPTDSVEINDSKPIINPEFEVILGKVIRNSFKSKENYLTIKGGTKNGIHPDMGVINSRGVLGIVEIAANNYATVQSILNVKSQINAKIKGSNHFGTLNWDGKNTGYVQLIDIPRLAELHKGDTIVTGGKSIIFPENIPIGAIDKVFVDKSSNYYTISVRLFNDMTNLGYVYIIKNNDIEEINHLEEATKDE